MFKRTSKFKTSFGNSKYIEEFMREYGIAHTPEILAGGVRYTAKMNKREFNAFSKYITDLGRLGVYPIKL